MTERQLRQLVKKYTSIALHTSRDGGYSPHKLRATTATSLIGRGNSIYDVAALFRSRAGYYNPALCTAQEECEEKSRK